jgi:hypothetical protein
MREGILKAGAFRGGVWQWVYHSGRAARIGYEADLRDPRHASVTLEYTKGGEPPDGPTSLRYPIELASTVPRFGGLRWWFVCPLVVRGRRCGRRAGKLHLPPGGRYFGCRHCYDLTYTSCQESHKFDGLWRLLARRTGSDPATVKRLMKRSAERNSR